MAQRTLVYNGNPILRQKARKIHRFDASLPQLIQDMFESMHAHDGIGLAAPQIGLSLRVFVVGGFARSPSRRFRRRRGGGRVKVSVVTLNRVPALLIAKVSRRPNSVVSVGMMLAKRSRAASAIFW